MTIANLVLEIKKFIPGNRLIELTNPDDAAAVAINDVVLTQACLAATGDFLLYAKTRPITSDPIPAPMFSLLYRGVLAHLHRANMRNDMITEALRRDFEMGCKRYSNILSLASFGTSETLLDEVEIAKSPFSKDRKVMQGGERKNSSTSNSFFSEYLD